MPGSVGHPDPNLLGCPADSPVPKTVAIPCKVSARFRQPVRQSPRHALEGCRNSPRGLSSISTTCPTSSSRSPHECRNPPQGFSSISTGCRTMRIRLLSGMTYRNPPQGLSSIPTVEDTLTGNVKVYLSQSPAGALLDSDRDDSPQETVACRMSQSPAGAQLDSDFTEEATVAETNHSCRNPPQGLSSFPTRSHMSLEKDRAAKLSQSPGGSQLVSDLRDRRWNGVRRSYQVSQSPAGSQLVSDPEGHANAAWKSKPCRNPPQGLSSFPTQNCLPPLFTAWTEVAIPRRVSARFRQCVPQDDGVLRHYVAIPRRVSARFRRYRVPEESKQEHQRSRNPPQGLSSFPTWKGDTQVPAQEDLVAIPRRVSARFRLRAPNGRNSDPLKGCRNPPQGLSSFPTTAEGSGSYKTSVFWSQSPAGSQLVSDLILEVSHGSRTGCRNPPQGLSSFPTFSGVIRVWGLSKTVAIPRRISARFRPACIWRRPGIGSTMSQSPAGSQLVSDGLRGTGTPPRSSRSRNPPQGLSSFPTSVPATYLPGWWTICRNPPQGLSSFPTQRMSKALWITPKKSQSPAGSQLVSDRRQR